MCASIDDVVSGSGILSKPRGRRSADRSTRGLQDATPICSVRRDAGSVSSPNRAAPRRHTFFFFRHAVFLTHRKLHSVARMFVSRCNFYACHTKGWASESGRLDGRDPFARATFRIARPSSARFTRVLARPSAFSRGG